MTSTVTVDLDADGVPDFTPPPGPRFRVYGEVYEGVREVMPDLLLDVLAKMENLEDVEFAEQLAMIKECMLALLTAESGERFVANMTNRAEPIGLQTLQSSMNWLIGRYTARPTEPDSDSSPGSGNPEFGTSSTETTSAGESTSSDYRLIDSST